VLTDISVQLTDKSKTKEEKEAMLRDELVKLNGHLPASVYIPFVNRKFSITLVESIRNYAVLHIPPKESRVF